ncbi:MAG: hypothetical protein KTR35_21815 [Gammaproteobacteria bacterium]|nr:hypothetical protein [Gammaproteobacteria bacterium]
MSNVYVCEEVEAIRTMHRDVLQQGYTVNSVYDWVAKQAETLLAEHAAGNKAVLFHLRCWLPELSSESDKSVLSNELSVDQAQLCMAREYGFAGWHEVLAKQDEAFEPQFEHAVDFALNGQADLLQTALNQNPNLVNQVSPFGHGAGLLHYMAANGVESHRQVTPQNALNTVQLLFESGCDVNATANMYGGNSTVLGLWETSAHPAKAGVQAEVSQYLIKNGAV